MAVSIPNTLDDEEVVIRSLRDLASIAVIKQSGITPLNQTQTTISGTYTQSELEALAAKVQANADKLDVILVALKAANVLGD